MLVALHFLKIDEASSELHVFFMVCCLVFLLVV